MMPKAEALEFTAQDNVIPISSRGETKAFYRLEFELKRGKVHIGNSHFRCVLYYFLKIKSLCKISTIPIGLLGKGYGPTEATLLEEATSGIYI